MEAETKPIRVGILTISDTRTPKSSANNFDSSGHCLKELVEVSGVIESGRVVAYSCVSCDVAIIQAKMVEWCSQRNVDVLLCTGGTGISTRDVTPEATLGLIQKQTPGITNAITNASLKITPMGMLFRGVSGIFVQTLIINLPDSEEAAKECLQAVACAIPHAISLIRDEKEISKQFHENLSFQVENKTKIPDCFTEISVKSAIKILREHSHVQYDESYKFKFPSVWIFSIGDKLVINSNKRPGSIIETNTVMIEQILKQDKYEGLVSNSDFVKENWDDICEHFEEAFINSDIIVTTGGVSVDDNDLVKPVLIKHFKSQIHFSGVDMKPGMSTTFATLSFRGKKKYVFCLSGDPVSAGVCTHLFILPYLRSVSGKRKIIYNFKAKLTHSIDKLDDRPEYERAFMKYDNGEFLVSTSTVASQYRSTLLSFFGSNCLIQLPSSTETTRIEKDTIMDVILIKSITNTYIPPVLKKNNWNIKVVTRSQCMNTYNNAGMRPDFIQNTSLNINDVLDLMENMFILCTKGVYTTSAMGYASEIEIICSEYKLPNFPAFVNDGYPNKYICADLWSRREDILNTVEVSVLGTAPNYPEEMYETGSENNSDTQSDMSAPSDGPFEDTFGSLCVVDGRIQLGPFEIAYLCSVSCTSLEVYRYPTVRIIPCNKYSMCGTSKMIKNILEVDGFTEKVYTYPVCQQLSNIALQYEKIKDTDDVLIFCTEEDMCLALEEIGNVEAHFHIDCQTISFGFGIIHLKENRLMFFHTTSCNPDYIYNCVHLFVLPFLRFTCGKKQRISAVKANCNTLNDLPTDNSVKIDSFEKSEFRYEEGDFELTCTALNRPNCLVKMPLLTELCFSSKNKIKLDAIVTENSNSYLINY